MVTLFACFVLPSAKTRKTQTHKPNYPNKREKRNKKRVNYLSCIEGKGGLKDFRCIAQKCRAIC